MHLVNGLLFYYEYGALVSFTSGGCLNKSNCVLLYLHSLRNEYLLAPLLSGKTDPLQKLEY